MLMKMKIVNKNIEGDNIVENMMKVNNRKLTPKNGEMSDDLKDGERERETENEYG